MPDIKIVSRIAPTPSGYLHKGNAFNFLLTYLLVRYYKGTLWLRIDDIDSARSRPEYIEDIYHTLEWLGIEPDAGPAGPDEFRRRYSQQNRMALYKEAVSRMLDQNKAYACRCSRREIREVSEDGLYPGTCRILSQKAFDKPYAMRCALDDSASRMVIPGVAEDRRVNLKEEMGDFVIWRKDDSAAYQVASVVDDAETGTNLLVRGEDLLTSSAAQVWLAPHLDALSFSRARFVHHSLLKDEGQQKLSKSEGALSIKAMREGGLSIATFLNEFCSWAGLPATHVASLKELGPVFNEYYGSGASLPVLL